MAENRVCDTDYNSRGARKRSPEIVLGPRLQIVHQSFSDQSFAIRANTGGAGANVFQTGDETGKQSPSKFQFSVDIHLAPVEFKRIIFSCASELSCNTQRCGCSSANPVSSVFCMCQGISQGCCNAKARPCTHQTSACGERNNFCIRCIFKYVFFTIRV